MVTWKTSISGANLSIGWTGSIGAHFATMYGTMSPHTRCSSLDSSRKGVSGDSSTHGSSPLGRGGVLADEPSIAVFLIVGDLPDGCRKLPRLQQPHARHGLGEAADHDPLVLPLAGEADRKGDPESVSAALFADT